MIPKEVKKQILEISERYNEPVLFPDNVQLSQHDVTLKWSDGQIVQYTFEVVPIVKNDKKTIELQTKLESTRSKPPSLDTTISV